MCDCITLMNEALEPHEAKLDLQALFDMRQGRRTIDVRPQILCYRIDPKKRKALPAIMAEYCPFCGDRYQWPDPKEMDDGHLKAELDRAERQFTTLERRREGFYQEYEDRALSEKETDETQPPDGPARQEAALGPPV